MSDVKSDALTDRYGAASPGRRRVVVIAAGVVGVLALTWLAWVVWFQSTPDVQSSLRTFDVVDSHSVSAELVVRPRSSDISASCLVRAFGEDHSVVGELNFKVAGESGTILRKVTLRTEREATSVELVGCTAAGQSRPR